MALRTEKFVLVTSSVQRAVLSSGAVGMTERLGMASKKAKKKDKYPCKDIVEIDWVDASSYGGGWNSAEHYTDHTKKEFLCKTAGFLLPTNDKNHITVVTNQNVAGDVGQSMTIPMGWIKRIKRLK